MEVIKNMKERGKESYEMKVIFKDEPDREYYYTDSRNSKMIIPIGDNGTTYGEIIY